MVLIVGSLAFLFLNKKQLPEIPENNNEFTYKMGDLYRETKRQLLGSGWSTYIPEGFTPASDVEFPEIGDCGNGIDAVCFVNFKKGEEYQHIIVQKGGRNEYVDWTTIGQE